MYWFSIRVEGSWRSVWSVLDGVYWVYWFSIRVEGERATKFIDWVFPFWMKRDHMVFPLFLAREKENKFITDGVCCPVTERERKFITWLLPAKWCYSLFLNVCHSMFLIVSLCLETDRERQFLADNVSFLVREGEREKVYYKTVSNRDRLQQKHTCFSNFASFHVAACLDCVYFLVVIVSGHCNTLQRIAAHGNTLSQALEYTSRHTQSHCNTRCSVFT